LSVGGVLGGLFNALLAPVIFGRTGLTEYPLAVVLACMIRPSISGKPTAPVKQAGAFGWPLNIWDLALPVGIGALTVAVIYVTSLLKMEIGPLRTGVRFGVPCILSYLLVDRPVRYALGLAA